jgi:hypothetical protein
MTRFGIKRQLQCSVVFLVSLCGFQADAQAQAFCSSDGEKHPAELLERFLNADCEACWKDPTTPKATAQQAVLDWVTPGNEGDDAPLSAVAIREGLDRLQATGVPIPETTSINARHAVKPLKGMSLRVAQGIVLSGYIGVSIELQRARGTGQQPLSAWLAMVEHIPAGSEGSAVARNLTRSVLQLTWDSGEKSSKPEPHRFYESRVMHVAEGVKPENLRVTGWIEDASGHVLSIAQSACK